MMQNEVGVGPEGGLGVFQTGGSQERHCRPMRLRWCGCENNTLARGGERSRAGAGWGFVHPFIHSFQDGLWSVS